MTRGLPNKEENNRIFGVSKENEPNRRLVNHEGAFNCEGRWVYTIYIRLRILRRVCGRFCTCSNTNPFIDITCGPYLVGFLFPTEPQQLNLPFPPINKMGIAE